MRPYNPSTFNSAFDHIPFQNAVVEITATERIDEGSKKVVRNTTIHAVTDKDGNVKTTAVETTETKVSKRGRKKKGESK